MNTKKIIRNLTASNVFVNDAGCTILASSDYIIPDREFLLWSESEDVQTYLDNGDLVLLLGEEVLSTVQSKIDIRLMPLALTELPSFYNWYKIPVGVTITIVDGNENMVTGSQTIDGTLIIDGRNTVL